ESVWDDNNELVYGPKLPTIRQSLIKFLRGTAGFHDPESDYGHRYPEESVLGIQVTCWALGNPAKRRDTAAWAAGQADRLERDPSYLAEQVLSAAEEHAKEMKAWYDGFLWERVIRLGDQPWNPIAIASVLAAQLPGSDWPGTSSWDAIDAVLRLV